MSPLLLMVISFGIRKRNDGKCDTFNEKSIIFGNAFPLFHSAIYGKAEEVAFGWIKSGVGVRFELEKRRRDIWSAFCFLFLQSPLFHRNSITLSQIANNNHIEQRQYLIHSKWQKLKRTLRECRQRRVSSDPLSAVTRKTGCGMFSEEQEASNGYLASFHAEAFRLHVNCFPFHSFVLSPAITSNNRKRIVKCFPIFIWSHNKKAKNRKKNPQDTTNGNRMKCCNNFSLAVFSFF